MVWQRLCLTLLAGWAITYTGIALLAQSSLEQSRQRANRQGLQFWVTKIEQYYEQGGSLSSDLSLASLLESLKATSYPRLNHSQLLDPYGNSYQLRQNSGRDLIIVSAGADGVIGSGDDEMIATGFAVI